MNDEIDNNKNGFERSFELNFDDNTWIVGIALILVGGLFMLDSFGIMNINMTNWWAIFILVPGLNMAITGWRRYQEDQSASSRKTGMIGLFLILLACTFFFNIAWSLIMPVFLIGIGVYLLFFR
jgi:hypothetical protein